MQSRTKRITYGILSIVFIIFSIPFNLLEDFLPKIHILSNNSIITVNAENSLKEQFIKSILENENIWQESSNGYMAQFSNSNVYCWFEDLNIDGIPEFIIGPMVSGTHEAHDYEIWTYKNNTLEPFNISQINYNDEEYSYNCITLWLHDVPETLNGKDSFRWQLFKDKTTNEYKYICIGADGVAMESYRWIDVLSCDDTSIINVDSEFSITTTSTSVICKVNGFPVKQDTFVEAYDKFFSNLTPYEITVSDFSYASYISSNDKENILKNSYDAWSYKENNLMKLPLSDEVNELRSESNIAINGVCGDNATWSFDKTTGTLTISGTGEMYDYQCEYFSSSWFSNGCYDCYGNTTTDDGSAIDFAVKNLIIEDGITSIGNWAFSSFNNLENINLPDTLTSIGDNAFRYFYYGGISLKSITIPISVTSIGNNALGYYGYSYVLDDGVYYDEKQIDDFTIYGYTGSQAETYAKENNITFIALDDYDKSVDIDFEDISIPDESYLYTDGDYQYMIVNNYAVIGKYLGNDKNVIIPETLGGYTVIAISGVEIPENDYQVDGAFESNENIVTVTMPNTIKYINDNAFMCCPKLEEVTFSTKLQIIGYNAFYDCKLLDYVDLSSTEVTTIMGETFKGCETLSRIELPNTLTEIYQEAFADCPQLLNIVIPKSVTMAGEKSFGFVDNDVLENFKMYIYYFSSYYDYCNENNIDYEWLYDTYEEYFNGVHYYFLENSPKKYYNPNYYDENSIYHDITYTMVWDYQQGELNFAKALDTVNDALSFQLSKVKEDWESVSDVSGMEQYKDRYIYDKILYDLILNFVDEESFTTNTKLNIINILNILNTNGSFGDSFISGIEAITQEISTTENLSGIYAILNDNDNKELLNQYSGAFEFIGSSYVESLLDYSQDVSDIIYSASLYNSCENISEDAYELMSYIYKLATNFGYNDLAESAKNYMDAINGTEFSTTLIDAIQQADNGKLISNILFDKIGDTISKFLSKEINDLKLAQSIASIWDTTYKQLKDIEKQELDIGYFLACNSIHHILYSALDALHKEYDNSNLDYSRITHMMFKSYIYIDNVAYDYANDFITIFTKNNSYIKRGFTYGIANELDIYSLKNTLGYQDYSNIDFSVIFLDLKNDLIKDWEKLNSLNCCNSISAKFTLEIKDWITEKLNKITIMCPITVEVYDTNNVLIVTITDDEIVSNNEYKRYFSIFNEIDENDNKLNTKAKVLLLPQNYTYKLIATDDGNMNVYNELVDYSSDEKSIELLYNFEDIPINQGNTFELNENTNGYILTNTTTGKTYTDSSSTDSTLHSNKTLIVTITLSIVIIFIISILIIKNKKRKNL